MARETTVEEVEAILRLGGIVILRPAGWHSGGIRYGITLAQLPLDDRAAEYALWRVTASRVAWGPLENQIEAHQLRHLLDTHLLEEAGDDHEAAHVHR